MLVSLLGGLTSFMDACVATLWSISNFHCQIFIIFSSLSLSLSLSSLSMNFLVVFSFVLVPYTYYIIPFFLLMSWEVSELICW